MSNLTLTLTLTLIGGREALDYLKETSRKREAALRWLEETGGDADSLRREYRIKRDAAVTWMSKTLDQEGEVVFGASTKRDRGGILKANQRRKSEGDANRFGSQYRREAIAKRYSSASQNGAVGGTTDTWHHLRANGVV